MPSSFRPPKQNRAIFKSAAPHLIRAINLAYYLGLRPGAVELMTLIWENSVDLEKGTIRIVSAKKGGPISRIASLHTALSVKMK